MPYDDPTRTQGATPAAGTGQVERHRQRRVSTETKASFKTTELIVYILAVAGVLIASYLVKTHNGHADTFRADKAWFYIVLLTIGYMGSRGLAKSGSRDYYDD
jgi:hypothetical protein